MAEFHGFVEHIALGFKAALLRSPLFFSDRNFVWVSSLRRLSLYVADSSDSMMESRYIKPEAIFIGWSSTGSAQFA